MLVEDSETKARCSRARGFCGGWELGARLGAAGTGWSWGCGVDASADWVLRRFNDGWSGSKPSDDVDGPPDLYCSSREDGRGRFVPPVHMKLSNRW